MEFKASLLGRRDSEDEEEPRMPPPRPTTDALTLVLTIAGGFLVHVSLCLPYAFGNLETYIVSFMKSHDTYSEKYSADIQWVLGLFFVAKVVGMLAAGWMNENAGPFFCTLCGCLLSSAGILLTSLTLSWNVWAVSMTLGLLSGAGTGLAYASPMAIAARLCPKKAGFINGAITAGYGVGAVVYNEAATAYVNPNNLATVLRNDGQKYFTDSLILWRTPRMFWILGGVSLGFQILGCAALFGGFKMAKLMGLPRGHDLTIHIPMDTRHPKTTTVSTSNMTGRIRDLDPGNMMRTRQFLLLWPTFCLISTATFIALAEYKNFGQTFITDDHYLAHVGTVSNLLGAVLRPLWGVLADFTSFKIACMALCSVTCLTFGSWFLTSGLPYYAFFIWTCVLALTISGNHLLFPLAVARSFGHKHYLSNMAVAFTALIVAGILSPTLTSLVMGVTKDWFVLFTIVAIASLLGLLLMLFIKDGQVEEPARSDTDGYDHILDK